MYQKDQTVKNLLLRKGIFVKTEEFRGFSAKSGDMPV
jgi:hypothetical protein